MMPRKLFGRVLTISAVVIALCLPLVYSRPQVSIESPQDENHSSKPAVVANIDISSLAGSNEIRYNTSFKDYNINNAIRKSTSNLNLGNYTNSHSRHGNNYKFDEVYSILGRYIGKEFQKKRKKRNINPLQYTSESRRRHYSIIRPTELISNPEPEYRIQRNYPSKYGTGQEIETFVSDNEQSFAPKYDDVIRQDRLLGNYNPSPSIITRQNKNNQRLNILNNFNIIKPNHSMNVEQIKTLSHTQLDTLRRLQRRLLLYKNKIINSDSFTNNHNSNKIFSQNEENKHPQNDRKPIIRKVFTQWTDAANFDDIYEHINNSSPKSSEHSNGLLKNGMIFSTSRNVSQDNGIENKYSEIFIRPKPYPVPRPQTVASSATHVFSNNIQVVDEFDAYGEPTPLVSYAKPSKPNSDSFSTSYSIIKRRPSTPIPVHSATRPFKYPSFHNNINNIHSFSTTVNPFDSYKPEEAENHTTYPISAFTDTVIIKPLDYNASPKCPTITFKLNNTIKSKSKEICPDLNIAINTQVVNENAVVDNSEELDSEEGEVEEEFSLTDSNDSNESNKESESAEDSTEESAFFSNAPASLTSEPEVEIFSNEASSSEVALGSELAHSVAGFEEDEEESFLDTWMGPVTNTMNWLAILNPFNYGVWSLVLAPLAVVLAGGSGLSALLAPWGIPYARSVLKYGNQNGQSSWFWDPRHNWYNFPLDKNWRIIDPRSFDENVKSEGEKNIFTDLIRKARIWLTEDITDTVFKSLRTYLDNSTDKNINDRRNKKWKTKRRRK